MKDFKIETDTVAAVSTPHGKGGVALIRISGPHAFDVAERVFKPKSGVPLRECGMRRAIFGEVKDPDTGEATDTAIATLFAAPASFTGEDTAEISCHGGILVTRAVLAACLAAGARQAEAGEFTRRAFALGKISLPEAESLGMLLDAGNDSQMRLSRSGLSGSLARKCDDLREEITELLADVNARLDFPEEDLGEIEPSEVESRLLDLKNDVAALGETYRAGRAVAEGIPTVICGRTNAGKSTFYNRLVGSDEAIVTDVEGTTRDVLTSSVGFGGVTLLLSDTAGIRNDVADAVEAIGVDRAQKKIDEAELVFFLIDGTREPNEGDVALASRLCASHAIVFALLSKSDVAGEPNAAALRLWSSFEKRFEISAQSGKGIRELAEAVSQTYLSADIDVEHDAVISNARQHEAIKACEKAVALAYEAVAQNFPLDVSAVCLEDALRALCELDGRGHGAVSADVIDSIFSRFCVGK